MRDDLMKVMQRGVATVLAQSLAIMDMEPQSVPTDGSTGDLRSRGYLLGVTGGIVDEFQQLAPSQDEFIELFAAAFAFVYGSCDWQWALDTIDALQANQPEVLDGVKLGQRDVKTAYSDQPFKTYSGFWLLNNGDEEAIEYNLSALR